MVNCWNEVLQSGKIFIGNGKIYVSGWGTGVGIENGNSQTGKEKEIECGAKPRGGEGLIKDFQVRKQVSQGRTIGCIDIKGTTNFSPVIEAW